MRFKGWRCFRNIFIWQSVHINCLVIWPKLFRRLIKHKRSGQPMSRFADRLAREKITIIPTVHHTRLDTAVEIQGNQLRLLHPPEDLVVGSVIR